MDPAGERSRGEDRPEGWPEERVAEFIDEISSAGDDYRRLVERLPAIVYSCELGERGRWRYVSPQIEDILGYSPEEWMADAGLWAERLHPEDRERALELETRMAHGEGNGASPIDYRMITRDGDVVWILDEAVLEPDGQGMPIWHGVLYDITERKLAEQELRRAAAQQAAVARLGRYALQDGDPARLAKQVVPLMAEIEGVEAACVWEAGREGRRLHLRAGLGERGGGERRASAARDSHAGAALESGLHVIVDDWSSERRYTMPPALRVLGVRSSLAVPIAGKERPYGVLDIHSTEPSRFTPQDVHFVQASANVLADALERHSADEALRHRVLHDALTGLPNRHSFVESLRDALRRGLASGSPVGVLFLDLDHFKLINDVGGHSVGDKVLCQVVRTLQLTLRDEDTVVRWGGEEFLLIIRVTDRQSGPAIAERVRTAVAAARTVAEDGTALSVTCSLGFAPYPFRPSAPAALSWEDVVSLIDAALYAAKHSGRDAWVGLKDTGTIPDGELRRQLKEDLTAAVAAGDIAVTTSLGHPQQLRWNGGSRDRQANGPVED